MNTPTPTNDEWIVTDNMNYIEIASTQTRDSIASVHGGKTVGEQYDLAGRIAKVPQLERELTAVTEQRDRLADAFESIIGEAAFEGIPESKQQFIHEALQYLNKPTEQ